MKNVISLIGQSFGRLTVVAFGGRVQVGNQKYLTWECSCVCGNQTKVYGTSLRAGRTKSCGCLQKEIVSKAGIGNTKRRGEKGEAGFNKLFNAYKRSAKVREYSFSLTKDEFRSLTQQNCLYCEAPPNKSSFNKVIGCTEEGVNNSKYIYNGIDRLDNSEGYTLNNSVSCCEDCNKLKHSVTLKIVDIMYKECMQRGIIK